MVLFCLYAFVLSTEGFVLFICFCFEYRSTGTFTMLCFCLFFLGGGGRCCHLCSAPDAILAIVFTAICYDSRQMQCLFLTCKLQKMHASHIPVISMYSFYEFAFYDVYSHHILHVVWPKTCMHHISTFSIFVLALLLFASRSLAAAITDLAFWLSPIVVLKKLNLKIPLLQYMYHNASIDYVPSRL